MTEEKKSMVPKLRFPEFTATWEQHKLGDLGHTYGGLSGKSKQDFGHGDARFVTYMNVFSNPIGDPCMVDSIEIDDRQSRVRKGDVLFTTSSETPDEVGMSCVWPSDSENLYLNSFCFGYRPTTKINSNFLASLLRSPSVREKIIFLAQGISRYNISKNKVMEISIPLPSEEEQSQIGDFFTQLDKTITLHQRKLEGLSKLKKSLLQKMIPKNGSLGPELRFPGFTGDWEQHKLGDLGHTYGGLSGKSKQDFGHGDARFVTYMNVFSNPIGDPCMVDSIEIDDRQSRVRKGDVLFTTSSETPDEVGMSCVWPSDSENLYLNSFCFGYRPTTKINSNFLASLLRSPSVREKIIFLAQGISRYNISKNKVMEISIPLPSEEEQSQIGDFFTQLDKTITLHQRKLESLKKLKKSLLQQMFV